MRKAISYKDKVDAMTRIEYIREKINKILSQVPDEELRKNGYIHLYGFSQSCVLIALKRNEDTFFPFLIAKPAQIIYD